MLEAIQDPGQPGIHTALDGCRRDRGAVSFARLGSCVVARVLRAAMGAHFALRVYEGADLDALVASYPGRVLAAARDGATPMYSMDLRGHVALLFGNEGAGLSPGLRAAAHATVSIPMPGNAESLNVAAAAAVCLFERVRQQAVNG